MKPKVIYLDGGPKNGRITYVLSHEKEYISASKKGIKYIYKEDVQVKGLFVYTGVKTA